MRKRKPKLPKHISLANLSPEDLACLEAREREWMVRLKPLFDATEASTKITAEDLAVTINC